MISRSSAVSPWGFDGVPQAGSRLIVTNVSNGGKANLVANLFRSVRFGRSSISGRTIVSPVPSMRTVSHDPTCRATVELVDGGTITAVDLQWEFLRLAQKYADDVGLEALGSEEVGQQVLERWEAALTALERDPMTLDGQLDWVTKLKLLDAYRERDSLGWDDPKMADYDDYEQHNDDQPIARADLHI